MSTAELPKSGPSELRPLIHRIFERHPEAAKRAWGPAGVTLAVLERRFVKDWHFVVEDADLCTEAAILIKKHGLPNTCDVGGVLIVGDIQ